MNFIKKLHGKVIECRNHKSLVQVGSKLSIINRECNVGSEVTFIKEDSKKMASYLFAIAAMDEDDFNRINYDYIATSLFDNYRQDI